MRSFMNGELLMVAASASFARPSCPVEGRTGEFTISQLCQLHETCYFGRCGLALVLILGDGCFQRPQQLQPTHVCKLACQVLQGAQSDAC